MEASSMAGMTAAAPGGTGVLAIEEEEQFENLHDVPFITVNRINGKIIAEVVKDWDPAVTEARIRAAQDVGYEHGHHLWAAVHGDYSHLGYGVVTLHFMPDGDK